MKTYIPRWIDKYSYIIITTLLRQYPAVCAELGKMEFMDSPNEARKEYLMKKRLAVESVLNTLDEAERATVSECFFKNKRIIDANVPLSESSVKRINKRVILALGKLIGEID